jgi:hypothetical protein
MGMSIEGIPDDVPETDNLRGRSDPAPAQRGRGAAVVGGSAENIKELAAEYVAAREADHGPGAKWSADTERRVSAATEALVTAQRCPKCGSEARDCTGRAPGGITLWRFDYDIRKIHKARLDAIEGATGVRLRVNG